MALHLLPNLLKLQLEKQLSRITQADVKVKSVHPNLDKTLSIEGIACRFKQNQGRLSIQKLKVLLTGWPGLKPKINEIEIDGLTLELTAVNNKITLPEISLKNNGGSGKVDLQKIRIKNAALHIQHDDAPRTTYDSLELTAAAGDDNSYKFTLSRSASDRDDDELLIAQGRLVLPGLNIDALLKIKHNFTKHEAMLISAVFGINLAFEGNVAADLNITGPLLKANIKNQNCGIPKG